MPERAGLPADRALTFGPFRLFPERKLLLEGERHVRIGSRALDLLVALVEQAGTLVTKEDLIARAWPDTFVEAANLRVHVAALRKALGDGQNGNRYLTTDPGRGYRFVAPVSSSPHPKPRTDDTEAAPYSLPGLLSPLIGRADVIASLVAQFASHRLVTIIGPGGIGKTSVALAAAHQLASGRRDGARFVEFAPLSNPALVPSVLASAFGLPTHSENPIPALIATLRQKHLLLVIDSCDHVLETTAGFVEEVLGAAPDVRILATSREPVRAAGERVFRLSPLGTPPQSAGLSAAEALLFPAIQLFVERAAASERDFRLTDANAPLVADICRRLDGIALAIELAAVRVNAFGLRELNDQLADRFRLLTYGRRAALPRHRTLRAALDWSYEILPEAEQKALCRLAMLAGPFDLDAATAVASLRETDPAHVIEGVANLVAKSLVNADLSGGTVRYRLLDTTRAYALEKLQETGEFDETSRRHATWFRRVLERGESDGSRHPDSDRAHDYARHLDNVRAALDWAYSPGGDASLGVALTVAAVPLWTHLSLSEECRMRVEKALSTPNLEPDPRRDIKLNAAFGAALLYTRGSGPEMSAAWRAALDAAARIGDVDYQLRALWGLWVNDVTMGRFAPALALAREFCGVSEQMTGSADRLVGDRIMGVSLYFLGDQTNARQFLERMLGSYVPATERSDIVRFQFDQRVLARATLAEVLWLRGLPDQALRAATTCIEEACAVGHRSSLSYALAQSACPTALHAGDLKAADRFVNMLLDQPTQGMFGPWNSWGRCFLGLLLMMRGSTGEGVATLRSALGELPVNAFHMRYSAFLGEMAGALARMGDIAGGVAAIDEALARAERHDERWCVPELLRRKGEILLLADQPDAAAKAEPLFHQSLDWARSQGALSWELRAAISLAELRRRQGRAAEGRDVLREVYRRFDEGFETRDLRVAKHLLDDD